MLSLHSTMLLLNLHLAFWLYSITHSLHSTMLLLNLNDEETEPAGKTPLHSTMLLLNLYQSTKRRCSRFPLHSTMLLLNRQLVALVGYLLRLYIPLCFYLIPESQNHFWYIDLLYIPLCFYLIRMPLCVQRSPLPLHSTMLLLNPTSCKPEGAPAAALHSTMLLLNPDFLIRRLVWLPLYIPLCFYLIDHPQRSPNFLLPLHSTMLLLNPGGIL